MELMTQYQVVTVTLSFISTVLINMVVIGYSYGKVVEQLKSVQTLITHHEALVARVNAVENIQTKHDEQIVGINKRCDERHHR